MEKEQNTHKRKKKERERKKKKKENQACRTMLQKNKPPRATRRSSQNPAVAVYNQSVEISWRARRYAQSIKLENEEKREGNRRRGRERVEERRSLSEENVHVGAYVRL